ncbi:MAG: phenylalanine--tRNA ligase subunit alpha [Candidatus Aenigmarchaeota archaeon]|nr:phenylalanine--tRNA ligase subunit alpha [Candidatus Aenigmarchaeota archaeon]
MRLIESLHPLERKILPFLEEKMELKELAKKSGLKEVEAMRALQWMENKKMIKISSVSREIISLDSNGEEYLKSGLPEKRFLEALRGEISYKELKEKTGLDDNEMVKCIGILKGKYAISVVGDKIEPTSERGKLLERGFPEEAFLSKLPLDVSSVGGEEKTIVSNLMKRKKVIKRDVEKLKYWICTVEGKKLISEFRKVKGSKSMIERLTPGIIKDGSWKGKKFRRYDVQINVPKIFAGKKQPYVQFIENARRKLVEMGFREMEGPVIELEFFNFDALFQPQNHPARDWSASYKIKNNRYGRLPKEEVVKRVKGAHENGWKTGSSGWGYKWDEKTASQLVARAHDTAISPRYLSKNVEIPGKYFSLVRCFRPDVIDSNHGVEFNQLGGFVVGESLNFRHLLGLLKQFVFEMTGIEKVKFLPDYFPFTEPSVQISAKHPEIGWMELAGAGIFRPELSEPLGVKEPVIAWGFGIDRLAMMKLDIKDIRELFTRDLSYLRSSRGFF